MPKYATIVADPPWHYDTVSPSNPRCERCGHNRYNRERSRCHCAAPIWVERTYRLPYQSMTLDEIRALPVNEMADRAAHLYLWTTQRYLAQAYSVLTAWGFSATPTVLVWSKPAQGMGGAYVCSAEFCLFARRGTLRAIGSHCGTVFQWPRSSHSVKPDAFLDLVEQISPGPYLEMFARRARFGWDYWGDESLGTANMDEAA